MFKILNLLWHKSMDDTCYYCKYCKRGTWEKGYCKKHKSKLTNTFKTICADFKSIPFDCSIHTLHWGED